LNENDNEKKMKKINRCLSIIYTHLSRILCCNGNGME